MKAVRKWIAGMLVIVAAQFSVGQAHALMLPDVCGRYISSGFSHPGLGTQCFLELVMEMTDP